MLKKFFVSTLCLVSFLFAYSYTCFPPVTPQNSLAINPVGFAEDKNKGGMETFFYYGLTENSDFCTSILTVDGQSNFSVMCRRNLGRSFTTGVRVNTFWFTPQMDYFWEDDLFIFQSSIASQFTFDYLYAPALYGVFCPGIKIPKISEQFNICCDVNPGYYLHEGDFANFAVRSEGFALDVVPSIGFEIGTCTFTFSVPMYNVTGDMTVTFGAWAYYVIKLNNN